MRIFLIDNSDHTRDVMCEFLEEEGHEVVCMKSGDDALKAFRREPAPVVILDLLLVGFGSIELLKTIKSEHPETEVIVTTSFPSLDSVVEVMRNDALDYLVKTDDLFASITSSLQRVKENQARRDEEKLQIESLRCEVTKLEEVNSKLINCICDPQTGLYDQSLFEETVTAEIARGKSHDRVFSIVLMRLNPDLLVNDINFNDQVADSTLPSLAQSLRERLRKSDLLARYDNHTLSIILPETGRKGATLVAESISGLCIDLIESILGDQDLPQAILQVGVASFPEDAAEQSDLIKLAEQRTTGISSDSIH